MYRLIMESLIGLFYNKFHQILRYVRTAAVMVGSILAN
jgi:hypothetical protein